MVNKPSEDLKHSRIGRKSELASLDELETLARLIERFSPHDGRFDLPIRGVRTVKVSDAADVGTRTMAQPGICIVANGAKCISLSKNDFEYDERNMVLYSAEVPVTAKIIKASREHPYLCLVIDFDQQRLSQLIVKVFPNGLPKDVDTQPIHVGDSNSDIIRSAIRLLEIIIDQKDADLLAPLMVDEILIRLLRSPAGASIAQIGLNDSNVHKISKAITWLKKNYAEPVKVEDLSTIAGMSVASFYAHFKELTSISPLQFQKALRLHEARLLLKTQMMDVSRASFQVGYSSVSQFSREYAREFGVAPSKDKGT